MRTSGAASDPMFYVPIVVAIILLGIVFGGPADSLVALEEVLRSMVDAVKGWF